MRSAIALGLLALTASGRTALADVASVHPGVTLVRSGDAAMTITDLCAPGVGVRATRFAERNATPGQWAQTVGAQVAINADFFDFPGWSFVLVRARGDGEEWPPEAEQVLQPSSYWKFAPGLADIEPSSLVYPAPWVSQVVGAYDLLIAGGVPHVFGPDEPFMLSFYRRSAIGLSADRGTLYFYASAAPIDGPGMAAQMIAMAAEAGAPPIDIATNQDGGGSTQLYVEGLGQVIDSGRPVNSHLGVYARGVGPASYCPTTRARQQSGGVASWDRPRLDAFVRGAGGALRHSFWDGASWAPDWETLTTGIASAPAVASWAPGRLDAFATRDDGTLAHVYFDGAAWGEDSLGGDLSSPPVATSWGRDRLDVFAVARDASLSHFAWTGTAWVSDSLGGSLASPPAVTAWSANRLDLFAAGTDGGMHHLWWDGAAFSGWEPLEGEAASQAAAVSWGPYRLDAFALARDGSVAHWSWNGAWAADSLGGTFASAPAVASWAANRLDVFAITADHTLQHAWWDGLAWSGWEDLGGALDPAHAPNAIARAANRLDLLAVGTDGAVWHLKWDGTAWQPWHSLGGEVAGPDMEDGGGDKPDIDASGGGLLGGCAAAPGGSRAPLIVLLLVALAVCRWRRW